MAGFLAGIVKAGAKSLAKEKAQNFVTGKGKGKGNNSKLPDGKGDGSESQEQEWEFHFLRPSDIQEKPDPEN